MKGLCFLAALSLTPLVACGDDAATDADGEENPRDREDSGPDRPRDEPDASTPRAGSGSAGETAGAGGDGAGGRQAPALPPIKPEKLGAGLDAPAASTKWTVFVYGHADHNLSNTFVRDIAEMAAAQIGDDVNAIVLADFDASQEIAGTNGATFREGAEWLRIAGGGAEPELLAMEEELNLDDPRVLAGAVAAAFRAFPSERRALILWDHGGAWNGGFGGDSNNGTDSAPQPMSPRDVAAAVASGLAQATEDNSDPRVDIFAFDTCLMAGAEVVFEFSSLADVYIANAEIDYGDGWDYDAFLTHLSRNPDSSAVDLAAREVELWDAHHESASFNDVLLRSHVALDTSALPALAQAIDALVARWLASEELDGAELGRASYFSLPPYMNQLESPQAAPELRDLGQFLGRMSKVGNAPLASTAQDARDALDAAIIARSQGSLREAVQQLGLHVELPLAAALSGALLRAYSERAVSFLATSRWNEALTAYDKLDDEAAPRITAEIFNNETPDIDNLPTIEFAAEGANVAEAQVDLARYDEESPNELLFFGVVGKRAIEPDSAYQFSWDGQLLTLPDGAGGVQAAYRAIWEDAGGDDEGLAASVMASFGIFETAAGEQLLSALLFQDGDTEAGLISFLDQPTTWTLADLATDLPGSTFTPVYVLVSLTTGDESLVSGSQIPIRLRPCRSAAPPPMRGSTRWSRPCTMCSATWTRT